MKKSGRQESSGNMNGEDKMKKQIKYGYWKAWKAVFIWPLYFHFILSFPNFLNLSLTCFLVFIILVLSESDMASYINFLI